MALSSECGRGRALGSALGAVMWGGFIMLITVECMWQVLGVVGVSQGYELDGRVTKEDGRSLEEEPEPGGILGMPWWAFDLLIRLVVLVLVCSIECITLCCYWSMYIKRTPDKYIPSNAIVPEDLKGTWKLGTFDCCKALGTCCCFLWCPACTFSDLWYRAGFMHAFVKDNTFEDRCPGWLFFAGACGYCAMTASDCGPCGHAILRGGISFVDGSDGGLGDLVPMRKRFGMPHEGCMTFLEDCCCYCWCGPCVGTQEYVQVMEVLDRGVQVAAPASMTAQVVGAPVVVTGAVIVSNDTTNG